MNSDLNQLKTLSSEMTLLEKKARLKALTEPLSATFIEAVEFMAMFVLLNEPLVTKMQCMTQIKLLGFFRSEKK